ncbi:MAG: peptide-methionine (S)-S-oxide reductase MsrA [Saprospiraceae bacterium]|nr:peptide-methionine (S)-S-oxide reductase MsrA [Saprospiraceae bacterium]
MLSNAKIILSKCPTYSFGVTKPKKEKQMIKKGLEVATFGAGCFWCVEAVYQELGGVEKVVSGYSGGKSKNPTYKEVCSGFSKHAEVAQIHYDPNEVSFETLVEVFFTTHDPTTLNRQGNDSGPQYRSVIFYHNEEQKTVAERLFKEFAPKYWDDPIVTEISPFLSFYEAEEHHQNFYSDNQNYPYCRIIINPKVAKFRKMYADKLKKEIVK